MGFYNVKQLIVVRKDLKMKPGKMAAQASHASLGALFKAKQTEEKYNLDKKRVQIVINLYDEMEEWLNGSFAKVVLAVHSEEELKQVYDKAIDAHLPTSYIVDNGTTVFHGVATPTCVGIGPASSEILDALFSNLKLY